ncbi:MAG: hypothetical protein ACKOAH_10195, partial [Pirellula sp.]
MLARFLTVSPSDAICDTGPLVVVQKCQKRWVIGNISDDRNFMIRIQIVRIRFVGLSLWLESVVHDLPKLDGF